MGRITASKEKLVPDSRFNSVLVSKFINCLMYDGKKSVATGVLYDTFDLVGERAKREPMEVFDQALKNVSPLIEVKPRRVGGATYQVPVEVRPERATSLAMRWLVQYARSRGGRSMYEKLADELIDAANERGEAVKKKEDTHKMAEANRAFAHYRW